jgi:hypothetical protein
VSINHANVFLKISNMLIRIHPWLLLQHYTVLKPEKLMLFLALLDTVSRIEGCF